MFGLAGVVAAAMATAGGASAAAVAPASSAGGATGQACPSGSHVLTGGRHRHDARGGQFDDYDLDGGGVLTLPVPPVGFEPDAATASDLELYGYPPRPSDATQMPEWHRAVATHRDNSGVACSPLPVRASVVPGSYFSGYIAQNSNNAYTNAFAYWTQPTATASTNPTCSDEMEVIWTGLGGYGNGNLLQNGTAQDHSHTTTAYGWYEYLGSGGSVGITPYGNFDIPAGHSVSSSTDYNASTQVATFYVTDVTANNSRSAQISGALAAGDYSGNSADWIVERPSTSGPLPMMQHSRFAWSSARATNAGSTYSAQYAPGSVIQVKMSRSSDGATLDYPNGFGNPEGWFDNWVRCA